MSSVLTSETTRAQGRHVLFLSARTPVSLEKMCLELGSYLARHPEVSLKDTAFTLFRGRSRFQHRRAFVCETREEAVAALSRPHNSLSGLTANTETPVILQIPDRGPIRSGFWQEHPIYLEAIGQCFGGLIPEPLPSGTDEAWFLQAYGLAELLLYLGLDPAAVRGRGTGELVAATVCGMLTPMEAFELVCAKGPQLTRTLAAIDFQEAILAFEPSNSTLYSDDGITYWQQVFERCDHPFPIQEDICLNFADESGGKIIPLLAGFEESLARLMCLGVEIDLTGLDPERSGRRVPLPAYRFEEERYWFDYNPRHGGSENRENTREENHKTHHTNQKESEDAYSQNTAASDLLGQVIDGFSEEKVDALLELIEKVGSETESPKTYTRAATIEEQLLEICCELLGIDELGINDNITLLGGDSMFAMQLSKRVHDTFGVDISPHHLFREPTLQSLADTIRTRR